MDSTLFKEMQAWTEILTFFFPFIFILTPPVCGVAAMVVRCSGILGKRSVFGKQVEEPCTMFEMLALAIKQTAIAALTSAAFFVYLDLPLSVIAAAPKYWGSYLALVLFSAIFAEEIIASPPIKNIITFFIAKKIGLTEQEIEGINNAQSNQSQPDKKNTRKSDQ